MESVLDTTHEIHFGEVAQAVLNQRLEQRSYSKVFTLVDENTKIHCLPHFKTLCQHPINEVITIKAGEAYKNIDTCTQVWTQLSQMDGDRKSLLINLGGGVVTDLGGFVAATFKRGIEFINIPTTLLAMVDASVGGKTGVDLGSLKNQVGVIEQPQMVLIFPEFLKTLAKRQLKSGFAEMLKHGLIMDQNYWNHLCTQLDRPCQQDDIQTSIKIKGDIVAKDPTEKNIRKKLNFGHTLGHAIESYFLDSTERDTLLHGEAIAIGMVLEAYLSHKLTGLSKIELDEIKRNFRTHFKSVKFSKSEIETILELLKHDKKNEHGKINFVLLKSIGNAVIDIKVSPEFLRASFLYYMER
ncbi:MAG: 3-dehydroquinate synthase [Bacteroidota bacterium]